MATTSIDALSPRELGAWRGMLRAHAALTKALGTQLERDHGLPLTSYEVLMNLHDAPDRRMRMSDLACAVILSRSGLTRLVDRLAREGLLVREACGDDARGAYAVLTDLGVERVAAARRTHLAGVRALFLERFTPAEQELLAGLWARIVPADGDVSVPAREDLSPPD
ncbi:MarR family transcriptional regulator [Conexibacter sp. W3-3-2]|uniref:MarR family transcriptional regulator n=1 Tax=Paraconexibacter algicola TaxID=2133960 RepID=A0A2T4UE19_9ACTN|nr:MULTISPECIES: MarR family transcriptional regulator [Solirubrobacterales]MTD43984.1 MarR family transcriptional regulator [Conexibacter sp. W3-3-2]PTL55715.1 MarR family transcriptional regulator [Paraconexibacter algicola]